MGETPRSRGWSPGSRAIAWSMALVALSLEAYRISRPGGLLSAGSYDTSVYLGSAVRLVHGVLPYRDFAMVQPGGLALLLSPLALISYVAGTRGSLIALTACTLLLAALNVLLVGRLLRHRGRGAVLVGCGLMAVYPSMYLALVDGQLEPLMDLFVLLGLSVLFRDGEPQTGRRAAAAGAVMGFGAAVFLPAAIPIAAALAVSTRAIRRLLLPLGAGVAGGFLLPNLPFLILAPSNLIQEVVTTQLERQPGGGRTPLGTRVGALTLPWDHGGSAVVAVILVALIAAGLTLGWARGHRPGPLGWFSLWSTLLMLAAQLAVHTYYPHYAAMEAPFLALLAGTAAAGVPSPSPRAAWALPGLAVAVTAFLAVGQGMRMSDLSWQDPSALVDALVPPGACALSPHTQYLMATNRFLPSAPGCSELVDPYATYLAHANNPAAGRAAFEAALAPTRYLVIDTSVADWFGGDWGAPLRAYIAGHFREVSGGPPVIYARDGG